MLFLLTVIAWLCCTSAQHVMMRYSTPRGGVQSLPATSTDLVAHVCKSYTTPLAVHACGEDAVTGGNPGPFEPATPMNVVLACGAVESRLCWTLGNNISNMCCRAILPSLSPDCKLLVRVFNTAGPQVLVMGQLDAWEASEEDMKTFPQATFDKPNLPTPPPEQVRSFDTSMATLQPVPVVFHDRHTKWTDVEFTYCGKRGPVSFGVGGTSLASVSEVYVCRKDMAINCSSRQNIGTDNVITVFHSILASPLEYGVTYIIRVFNSGHWDNNPTIMVEVANTVMETPAWVLRDFLQNFGTYKIKT